MKKLLCYLGILILLFLLLLPPALRIFLKDKETQVEVSVSKNILICKNDDFITTTTYEGTSIKKIIIKRNIPTIEEDDLEEDIQIVYDTDIDKIIDDIKSDSTLIYEETDEYKMVTLDFEVSNYKDLNLSLITKPINDQKTYYEAENLTCSIKELS